MSPRRAIWPAGVSIILLLGAPASHADCVGPAVGVARRPDDRTIRVDRGQSLEIVGRYWTAECNDTFVGSTGCIWGGEPRREPSEPIRDITLVLRPGIQPSAAGGPSIVLVDGIDADAALTFRESVEIPEDLDPGVYRIEAGSGPNTTFDPLILRVR